MNTQISPTPEPEVKHSALIWIIDGNTWPDRTLLPWLACLTEAEQQRYRRFIRPTRQREFLIGRILLRFAMARLTDLSFSDISVIERKGNAPLPVIRQNFPLLPGAVPFLSLSHSRGWLACAVSADTPLGLDIEMLDASRDVTALGLTALTAAENRWLSLQSNTGDADQVAPFYALWTAKEALFKLACNVEHQPTDNVLVEDDIRMTSGENWSLHSPLHTQLAICLCTRHPVAAPLVVTLTGASPFSWAMYADTLNWSRKGRL